MDIRITCYHTASLCGMCSQSRTSQKQLKYMLQAGSRHKFEAGATVNRFGEQPMRAFHQRLWRNRLAEYGVTREVCLSVPDDDGTDMYLD